MAIQIDVPRPLEHQQPILVDDSRFKLLVCGRRWGKTVLAITATILGHGRGRRLRGALDGGTIWYIAPTFSMAMDTWRVIQRVLSPIAVSMSQQQLRLELPGGGSISIKSGDNPDSLRGAGLDGAVLDEAAFLAPEVWS